MRSGADWFNAFIDLAQPRLGARVIEASDDFFAPKERLIKPEEPVFIADKYDDHGKWMDGWESRRKRGEGHDYCIVQLMPGFIHGVEIDTRHFTGNYPPAASLDVCHLNGAPGPETRWRPLLDTTALQGDHRHFFRFEPDSPCSHIRLNIYPDGGVARLRVYGVVRRDWSRVDRSEPVDLAAMENGGRALACNDMHYGHMSNLIAPGRGVNMGDGWETRRRRTPGHDWAVLKLGTPGIIEKIEVDTAWFKGNYPAKCSVQGALLDNDPDSPDAVRWQELLPEVELGPDQVHTFEQELQNANAFSHVKLNIFPDGGVSRLRLYGTPLSQHE